jgi:uncharacterized RDD family membrane protein YckC
VDIAGYRAELRAGAAALSGAPAAAPLAAPAAPAAAPPPPRPAGFWIRVAAVLIDSAVMLAAQLVLWLTGSIAFRGTASPLLIGMAVRAFVGMLGLVYPVVFHWLWGQTLGKMAMGIRVVTVDGGPLSLGGAVVRQLGSVVSALVFGIGYLMAGLRPDKRALHDLIAGTRVERL